MSDRETERERGGERGSRERFEREDGWCTNKKREGGNLCVPPWLDFQGCVGPPSGVK